VKRLNLLIHHAKNFKVSRIFVRYLAISLLSLVLLNGCGSLSKSEVSSGRYYQDDGPPESSLKRVQTADAIPTSETLSARGNKPYTVRGERYFPTLGIKQFTEKGEASWYGKKYHGRTTSSGEVYDMFQMTAAHKTLPLPSYIRVTNLNNQASVVVKVNDRGPFLRGRIVDLSYAAAKKIGLDKAGVAPVKLQLILPPSY